MKATKHLIVQELFREVIGIVTGVEPKIEHSNRFTRFIYEDGKDKVVLASFTPDCCDTCEPASFLIINGERITQEIIDAEANGCLGRFLEQRLNKYIPKS